MKEASGELNMTIVTVVAIAAILAFATLFVPKILNTIETKWGTMENANI
jgi:hypothetical protein